MDGEYDRRREDLASGSEKVEDWKDPEMVG